MSVQVLLFNLILYLKMCLVIALMMKVVTKPILDSYVRKDEVKQSVIEGEKLPISSGAVFTALQGISGDIDTTIL